MTASLCFIVLDHRRDRYFYDLIDGLRTFCPIADIVWYDSGPVGVVASDDDPPRLPCSRPLRYAKVAPFFLDIFEWSAGQSYDYIVNVESDMAFIREGFECFVARAMRRVDYLAPGFVRKTSTASRWRPYHSLRSELPELLSILDIDYTNRSFSPGQVFSAKYIATVLSSTTYGDLRAFVERNQGPCGSFSLQEVLLPTLAEALGLRVAGYPAHLASVNRYRPYHGKDAISRILALPDAYFLHPVRRAEDDAARGAVRALVKREGQKHVAAEMP